MKDKFESEMKKEIKKLQRQRDFFRTNQNNPDIKDKTIIELLSITGGLIKIIPVQTSLTEINISDLTKGVYIIKVSNKNIVAFKSIIKE